MFDVQFVYMKDQSLNKRVCNFIITLSKKQVTGARIMIAEHMPVRNIGLLCIDTILKESNCQNTIMKKDSKISLNVNMVIEDRQLQMQQEIAINGHNL